MIIEVLIIKEHYSSLFNNIVTEKRNTEALNTKTANLAKEHLDELHTVFNTIVKDNFTKEDNVSVTLSDDKDTLTFSIEDKSLRIRLSTDIDLGLYVEHITTYIDKVTKEVEPDTNEYEYNPVDEPETITEDVVKHDTYLINVFSIVLDKDDNDNDTIYYNLGIDEYTKESLFEYIVTESANIPVY